MTVLSAFVAESTRVIPPTLGAQLGAHRETPSVAILYPPCATHGPVRFWTTSVTGSTRTTSPGALPHTLPGAAVMYPGPRDSLPTGISATIRLVLGSILRIDPTGSCFATHTACGVIATPSGAEPEPVSVGIVARTLSVAGSIRETLEAP